ncbi:acyl carrier protein [Streptomyces sp. NRRL S-350]|uniref:acyl carrier protein n=1 Tax=Streptomyces sp. NRRL S-350 TaxID=1463902 RepID=UPI0004C1EAC9|nr:phosphopantetheine-binding protein [Streptomyces sp. NRRL S-350]
MNDTKDRLRRLMVESLRLDIAPEAIPDTNLRDAVGIDSVMGLEFLIWVENEFGIQIQDEDLSVELVDSLDALAAYVDERAAEAAAARG